MANNKASEARPLSKSAVYKELANSTGLTSKQVASVFEALDGLVKQQLSKKGAGQISIPGLVKLKLVKKPATKGGVRPNPFKPGEMMEVKPKPATTKVKSVVLKGLKDLNP
jgi:nucleoid DNA-binding protein